MNHSEFPRHNGNFWAAAWECLPKQIWQYSYVTSRWAAAVTVTGCHWFHRAFLGSEAIERYKRTWQLLCAIGQLLAAIAFWVYAHVKIWVDAQVDANLPKVEPEQPAEVLTPVSAPPLSFKDWVLIVVFKVRATILRFLHPQQTVANSLDGPQLQPCL